MNEEIKEILEMLQKYGSTNDKVLLGYITNLQQENQTLQADYSKAMELIDKGVENSYKLLKDYKSRCEKAIEYITSYEAISTIQGLDKIGQNKTLDERTMNVMVERYLQVHHNLLNILQNGSEKDDTSNK